MDEQDDRKAVGFSSLHLLFTLINFLLLLVSVLLLSYSLCLVRTEVSEVRSDVETLRGQGLKIVYEHKSRAARQADSVDKAEETPVGINSTDLPFLNCSKDDQGRLLCYQTGEGNIALNQQAIRKFIDEYIERRYGEEFAKLNGSQLNGTIEQYVRLYVWRYFSDGNETFNHSSQSFVGRGQRNLQQLVDAYINSRYGGNGTFNYSSQARGGGAGGGGTVVGAGGGGGAGIGAGRESIQQAVDSYINTRYGEDFAQRNGSQLNETIESYVRSYIQSYLSGGNGTFNFSSQARGGGAGGGGGGTGGGGGGGAGTGGSRESIEQAVDSYINTRYGDAFSQIQGTKLNKTIRDYIQSFTQTSGIDGSGVGLSPSAERLINTTVQQSVKAYVDQKEIQGLPGPRGDPGELGPRGPQGHEGATGEQGGVGPVGPTGSQGPAGIQGHIGPDGPTGIPGVQGPPGTPGTPGIPGAGGPPGRDGQMGPRGAQGPAGQRGLPGKVTVQKPDKDDEEKKSAFDKFVAPKITERPRDTYVTPEGEGVNMKCRATGNPKPFIVWIKDNTNQARLGEDFVLEPAKSVDSGHWTCTARNFMGTDTASTNLVIAASPKFTIRPVEKITAFTGQVTELKCAVEGFPTPEVNWRRSGGTALPFGRYYIRGTNLYLNKPEPRDAGIYTCIASNPGGSDVGSTMVSVQNYEPIEFLTIPPSVVHITQYDKPVLVNCSARGKPLPNITWVKDGVAVPTKRYLIGNQVVGELHLDRLIASDQGEYICHTVTEYSGAPTLYRTKISLSSCPGLNAPQDGRKIGDEYFAGSVVRFVCNTGCMLYGSSARVCGANGRWSGTQPTCHNVGLVAYECHHYSLLTEQDRNINFKSVLGKCDNNLAEGWYRLGGAAGTQMSSSCPGPGRCDAQNPGWLYGAHPDRSDGCVERQVCFGNYEIGCCTYKRKVLVRDCGGYYVYKLGPAPGCNFRYCGISNASNGRYNT